MPTYTTPYLSNASNGDLIKDFAYDENPVVRELAGRLVTQPDIDQLEEEACDLRNELDEKVSENEELQTENAKLEEANTELEKENETMAEDMDRLIETLTSHTETMAALTAALLGSKEIAETPPVSATVVEAESVDPSPTADASTTPPSDTPATRDDVKAAVIALAERTGSRDTALAILKKHGATSLPTLDESKYADVVKDCEAA